MLANRNLRFLVLGQFISAIGDHFYLIALPWLGLTLTGSALVAGTLLAIAGVPRSVFMLLGGAATDRFSAKKLLILSNGLQGVLMAVFGAVLLRPSMQLMVHLRAGVYHRVDRRVRPAGVYQPAAAHRGPNRFGKRQHLSTGGEHGQRRDRPRAGWFIDLAGHRQGGLSSNPGRVSVGLPHRRGDLFHRHLVLLADLYRRRTQAGRGARNRADPIPSLLNRVYPIGNPIKYLFLPHDGRWTVPLRNHPGRLPAAG